jgi:hypothetical protein
MNDEREPSLQAAFANATRELAEDPFLTRTMQRTDTLTRRRVVRRIGIALLLGLLAMPLQDFALAVTPVLAQSLIDLDAGLATQLLAPVNSVAGLLSMVLLTLRAAHRRLFA